VVHIQDLGGHYRLAIALKPSKGRRPWYTELRSDDLRVASGTDEITQTVIVGPLKSFLRCVHGPIIGPGPGSLQSCRSARKRLAAASSHQPRRLSGSRRHFDRMS
jgi:hypothetical protein